MLTEKGEIEKGGSGETSPDFSSSDKKKKGSEELDEVYRGYDNKEEHFDQMDPFKRHFYSIFNREESRDTQEIKREREEKYLGDKKLIFTVFLENDDGEITDWIQTIGVTCSFQGKEIGRAFGRFVLRNKIRATFWRFMEEAGKSLSQVAFELFDRYGRLNKEFKDHPIRKGTGAWGSELDLGSFFMIEDILVDKRWRRKAIGIKMINYLIETSRRETSLPLFSLVGPGWFNRDLESEIQGKTLEEQREITHRTMDIAVLFFRSLRFRRIGASSFFGLTTDVNHPARAILSADDFDPAEEDPDNDEAPAPESVADLVAPHNRKSWVLRLLKDRLPLHHAAITLPDGECVKFFKAWRADDNLADEWKATDQHCNTVLHIAACESKVQTVRWLLNYSGDGQVLSLARNVRGYTPIEELESTLEKQRTQRGFFTVLDISDNFSGFAKETIGCLAALRNLGILSPTQHAQLKYACSCGLCIGGFLSSRMRFALLCEVEGTKEVLGACVEDPCMWSRIGFVKTHLAPDFQQSFAESRWYRQGLTNIFGHAATILRNQKAPSILNFSNECANSSEWPPYTKHFLQRVGNGILDIMLRVIFEQTRDQDMWAGDGILMEVYGDEFNALPECRNDHEFGFVALACGVPDLTRLYR